MNTVGERGEGEDDVNSTSMTHQSMTQNHPHQLDLRHH